MPGTYETPWGFRSDRPERQRCAGGRCHSSPNKPKLNLEQQLTETVALFARAGWADGNHEEWDNTDIKRSAKLGFSVNGKLWDRPDDTVGIAGVVKEYRAPRGPISMLEAWASSSATDSFRMRGWSRS